jgi:hypothetical protein
VRAEDVIRCCDDRAWSGPSAEALTANVESVIERGGVLWFPSMPFTLLPREQRLLDPAVGDAKAKNISVRPGVDGVRGTSVSGEDAQALLAMITRFRDHARTLALRLFPHYAGHLTDGNTSFRPYEVEGRARSWRQDDARLHVDAFPSNPMHGQRLLRVFNNINPHGQSRSWRIGEPFEAFARRHVGAIDPQWPGKAALMSALHITKRPRSQYDHYMLQLHDRAKADMRWQREVPQVAHDFTAGSTWVMFSDQVLHAVTSGQFMIEQTFTLQPAHQKDPSTSPLAVLERLTGRRLLAH